MERKASRAGVIIPELKMQIDELVDGFVAQMNRSDAEPLPADEVPGFLQKSACEKTGFCQWRIKQADFSKNIADLENRLRLKFPPSFRSLITRYAFPAFKYKGIMFFANTGGHIYWELSDRIFKNEYISPFLRKHGFIQIGNPDFTNYDPLCFDTNQSIVEYPIVQIDHEKILIQGRLKVVKSISSSFADYLGQDIIHGVLQEK